MVGEHNMGESGWWLASDGRHYPPDLHPSRRKMYGVDLQQTVSATLTVQETNGSVGLLEAGEQPTARQSDDEQPQTAQTVIALAASERHDDAGPPTETSAIGAKKTLQRRCRSCWQMTSGYSSTCDECGADPVATAVRTGSATTPKSIFASPVLEPEPAEPAVSSSTHPSPRRSVIAEAFGLPRVGSILVSAGCLIAVVGTMCTALLGERFAGELRLITIMSGLALTLALTLTLMGIGYSLRVSGADASRTGSKTSN